MTSIHHSICISSFHWRTLPFILEIVKICYPSSPQTDIDTRNGMQQSIAHSLIRKEWHITSWNKDKRFPQREPPLDSKSAIQAIPCLVKHPTPCRRRLDNSQHRILNRRRESSCDQNRLQFAKPIVPLFSPTFGFLSYQINWGHSFFTLSGFTITLSTTQLNSRYTDFRGKENSNRIRWWEGKEEWSAFVWSDLRVWWWEGEVR